MRERDSGEDSTACSAIAEDQNSIFIKYGNDNLIFIYMNISFKKKIGKIGNISIRI